MADRFSKRVLPVTLDVADACGRIVTKCGALGRPIGVIDAFIAATADVDKLAAVTRNESDFESAGATVFNPWSDQPGKTGVYPAVRSY